MCLNALPASDAPVTVRQVGPLAALDCGLLKQALTGIPWWLWLYRGIAAAAP